MSTIPYYTERLRAMIYKGHFNEKFDEIKSVSECMLLVPFSAFPLFHSHSHILYSNSSIPMLRYHNSHPSIIYSHFHSNASIPMLHCYNFILSFLCSITISFSCSQSSNHSIPVFPLIFPFFHSHSLIIPILSLFHSHSLILFPFSQYSIPILSLFHSNSLIIPFPLFSHYLIPILLIFHSHSLIIPFSLFHSHYFIPILSIFHSTGS